MSKKLIAIALAVTFVFSAVSTTKAVTMEEILALITALSDKITAIQAQIAGQTTTGMICFDTDLKYGMTSGDVKNLQIKLGVTPTSGYFGPITLAAVKTFQASKSIITTGYVGKLTRTELNKLYCVPPTPPTSESTTTTTTTTTVAPLTGGEGTLTASAAPVYTETTLKWGTANQVIYGFKVKASNSDIAIKRIFVNLTGTNLIPWKDLSYISLYDGDNAIKGIEVTKANLVENDYATDYDVYFDGLNVVVAKGAEKTFTIKVTTLSTPENRIAFNIALPINGVRGVDGLGLNEYNSSAVALKNVQYEETRVSATVQIRSDSSTPPQGIITGSKSEVTKDQTIFKFGLKATNNDATLKTAAVTLTENDNDLLTGVYLFDGDNTRLASYTPTATTSAQTASFTDLNVSIAKDTTKYLTVKVDIAKVDGSTVPEGKTISSIATAATSSFAFIDANDNAVTSVTGLASGNTQTVYTAAPVLALSSTPKLTLDNSTTSSGVAQFVFTVKAQGDTLYIRDNIADFEATSTNPTYMTLGSGSVSVSKAPVTGYFAIDPDETVTFTVEYPVTAASTTPAMVQAQLYNIKWNTSATTTDAISASAIYNFYTWKTNAQSMHN